MYQSLSSGGRGGGFFVKDLNFTFYNEKKDYGCQCFKKISNRVHKKTVT